MTGMQSTLCKVKISEKNFMFQEYLQERSLCLEAPQKGGSGPGPSFSHAPWFR